VQSVSVNQQIEFSLALNAEMSYNELRKLETSLVRILSMVSRFTGGENITRAIRTVERMIMTLRTLQIAIRAVEMAAGPIGWLYAATTVAAAGFTVYDAMQGV
jgi:hypothetical protein